MIRVFLVCFVLFLCCAGVRNSKAAAVDGGPTPQEQWKQDQKKTATESGAAKEGSAMRCKKDAKAMKAKEATKGKKKQAKELRDLAKDPRQWDEL